MLKPLGVTFAAYSGETVMHAAERAGLQWPTVCHGNAQCGTCYVEVLEGADKLQPPENREQRALRMSPPAVIGDGTMRLACQLRAYGDLKLHRRHVRKCEPLPNRNQS